MVALPEYRAWAELVAVPAKYVYKLPNDLSYLDAVTITMNYTVAYILLFEIGGLTQGKSILVHSVGGGVVSLCVLFFSNTDRDQFCFPLRIYSPIFLPIKTLINIFEINPLH